MSAAEARVNRTELLSCETSWFHASSLARVCRPGDELDQMDLNRGKCAYMYVRILGHS